MDFVRVTSDVCQGFHTCLTIIEANRCKDTDAPYAEINMENCPLLVPGQSDALQEFAIASSWLLHDFAQKQVNSINAHGVAQIETMNFIRKALKPDAE